MNRTLLFVALVGVTASLPLEAQRRGQVQDRSRPQSRGPAAVPPGHRPGVGMCRIWIDGLPPGRQPRETDCATARREVPSNGRVLEGPARTSGTVDPRWPTGRADRDGRDRDDRTADDDRDRSRRAEDRDNDDDDGRTRRYIDRNGLECEEKAVTKNGRRSYDLKCREPKVKKDRDDNGTRRPDDDQRFCIDADRDGRCDAGIGRGYPSTLPEMLGALAFGQGTRTDEVERWLGTGRYQVRYADRDRDRKPESVRWLDGSGSVVQEWMDNNRDGRADIVNIYNAGRIIQSLGGARR